MSKEIRNIENEEAGKITWGECIPRKMTDEERLKYGKPRPTTAEIKKFINNPRKAREYQNTYGISNEDMAALRACINQQTYEHSLYAQAGKKAGKVEDIEIIPMGLRGEAIVMGR